MCNMIATDSSVQEIPKTGYGIKLFDVDKNSWFYRSKYSKDKYGFTIWNEAKCGIGGFTFFLSLESFYTWLLTCRKCELLESEKCHIIRYEGGIQSKLDERFDGGFCRFALCTKFKIMD